MGIFGKSKSESELELTNNIASSQNASKGNVTDITAVHENAEIKRARAAFEAMAEELAVSQSKQESAQSRMSTLRDVIGKMELDLNSLRRVEHENRLLKNSERDFQTKLAQKTSWARELDSKLSDLERRHGETLETLKAAQADLATSRDRESDQESQIVDKDKLIRTLTARAESGDDRIRHANQSAEKLRDAMDEISSQLAQRNREVVELTNALEALESKYETKTKTFDASSVELKNLRLDYDELKNKHIETSGRLESFQYDMRTQKGIFDDSIKRREEENLALKTRIDQLETQVRIKENMSSHLDQEFISLRNELLSERDRATSLEQRLMQKSEEIERTSSALAKSKIEFQELNSKFAATLEDFETMRRINQSQREKLERYASIGGVTSGQIMVPDHTQDLDGDASVSDKVTVLKPKNKK
jgi:chromosome segregation ATPase